jgi:hypothetical protein
MEKFLRKGESLFLIKIISANDRQLPCKFSEYSLNSEFCELSDNSENYFFPKLNCQKIRTLLHTKVLKNCIEKKTLKILKKYLQLSLLFAILYSRNTKGNKKNDELNRKNEQCNF